MKCCCLTNLADEESRQRGALDAWIKKSKEEVGEVKYDIWG